MGPAWQNLKCKTARNNETNTQWCENMDKQYIQ